jgi:hypothetical protein
MAWRSGGVRVLRRVPRLEANTLRIFPVLVLVLALTVPAFAQGAVPREARQPYLGSFSVVAATDCGGSTPGYGTACFALDGSERTVSLEVRDVTGLTVPFLVTFEGAGSGLDVCAAHVEDLPVPAGATHVSVMVWGAPWTPFVCPGVVASGVSGEVVARFA